VRAEAGETLGWDGRSQDAFAATGRLGEPKKEEKKKAHEDTQKVISENDYGKLSDPVKKPISK
jgi:hypothetical protein